MAMINESLAVIRAQIEKCNHAATLIAVSKKVNIARIEEAYALGIRDFGESYVQEFIEKYGQLSEQHHNINWHFIGHLQSRKVKDVVGKVCLIHSVDRLKLVKEINRQACIIDVVQPILIQIKLADEDTKSGVELESLESLIDSARACDGITLKGFMLLPPKTSCKQTLGRYFAKLSEVGFFWFKKPVLSMGMSADYAIALQHGATHIRVGTQLFGRR